jgi:hypothetical protein
VLLKPIVEYFRKVQIAIGQLPDAYVELYEEELLATTRANLRIRVRFLNQSLLEVNEAIILEKGKINHLGYRYHLQDRDNKLIFRYDNTPHHPGLKHFPEHKHSSDNVLPTKRPTIADVIKESQI